MCGIAGFYNSTADYIKQSSQWLTILNNMNQAQRKEDLMKKGVI